MSAFGNSTAKKEYRPLDNHYREVEDLSYALSLRLASSVGEALLKPYGKHQTEASQSKSPHSKKLDEPGEPQDASPDSNATKEGDDDPVDADYQKYYDEVSSIIKANKALLDTIGGCLSEIASFHGIDEEDFDSMPNDAYEALGSLPDSTAKEEDDGPAQVPLPDTQSLDEDDDGSLFSLFNDTPPEKTEEPDYAEEIAQLLYNITTLEKDGGPVEATSQQPQELDKYDGGPLFSLFNEVPPPNNDEDLGEDADTSSSTTTTDSDSDSDSDSTEILPQEEDDPADQEKLSRIIQALINCELSKAEANPHRRQAPPPPANNLAEEEARILESLAGPGATPAEKEELASSAEQVRQRLAAQSIESIPEDVARARAAWRASAARRALVQRRRRSRLRAQEEEEDQAARVRAGERMAMEVWGRALGGTDADPRCCCGGGTGRGRGSVAYCCFEPALEGFRRIAEMGERAFAELEGRLREEGRDFPSSSYGWAGDV
ncbi:hypothetical protein VPNG_03571 [Cytospora leucostoma]|uniref:Uncharacterized protein n=1 Tax=Cytospora leucostoma TaxID=1230097 RepID=A0A423XD19_9PEZI|nr:hypothetical protein VPNG_03571 [Cytospora leucostoma]